jgi:hypothetical protein
MDAIFLALLIIPHIALGIAWAIWALSPPKFQAPTLRTMILFSGLLACSLNIAIFWVYVVWMNLHRNDPSLWKVSSKVEGACDGLIILAILAATFGKGQARLPILFAAMAGWAIHIVGHIGVL